MLKAQCGFGSCLAAGLVQCHDTQAWVWLCAGRLLGRCRCGIPCTTWQWCDLQLPGESYPAATTTALLLHVVCTLSKCCWLLSGHSMAFRILSLPTYCVTLTCACRPASSGSNRYVRVERCWCCSVGSGCQWYASAETARCGISDNCLYCVAHCVSIGSQLYKLLPLAADPDVHQPVSGSWRVCPRVLQMPQGVVSVSNLCCQNVK
jgi:hypothetical protein